jgi:methylated-DNA-[protein]-cysteine S-methyltransferase
MGYVFFYRFKGMNIGIAEESGVDGEPCIVRLFFGGDVPKGFVKQETALLKKAAGQMEEYFAGKRKAFSLPLALKGTEFQMSVWKALQSIPYGETRSYKDVAALVGNAKATRAVGMANNRNPVAIIVPCHRVIGYNGALVGYAAGVEFKRLLLDLEQGKKP